jgi:tRNA U34 5-carboxymethylaminomethyl modifying GTPase MnmE/TrmE
MIILFSGIHYNLTKSGECLFFKKKHNEAFIMIVSKPDIEAYTKFIEKALGKKNGYKNTQRQEILEQFSQAGLIQLENLIDSLKSVLESGESPQDFTLEDVQAMLNNSPDTDQPKNAQEEYKKLKNDLVIIPEELKQSVFTINDVMTRFLYRYPMTAVLEILITSLKKRLSNFFSRFFQ